MQSTITPTLALGRSGKWEIRYSEKDDQGQWRSRTVSTRTADRKDAERFLAGWHSAYKAAANAGPHTVSDLIDHYETDAKSRGVTRSTFECLIHIRAAFGAWTPEQIDQQAVMQYQMSRRNGNTGAAVAPNTLRRELAALVAVLRHAVKSSMLTADKLPYIPQPQPGVAKTVTLNLAQEQRLLDLAAGTSAGEPRLTRMHRFIWLALCTGARKSAMLELTWDQVDLANKLIDYRNQKRTKKRRVAVPISDRLLPLLQRACDERDSGYVLDHPRDIAGPWLTLIHGTEFEHVRIHDLRRTFATLLAQAGVDLWQVAGLLGDTIEIVAKHYAHHAPDYLRNAVNRRAA